MLMRKEKHATLQRAFENKNRKVRGITGLTHDYLFKEEKTTINQYTIYQRRCPMIFMPSK
jgi:hypothetical protein